MWPRTDERRTSLQRRACAKFCTDQDVFCLQTVTALIDLNSPTHQTEARARHIAVVLTHACSPEPLISILGEGGLPVTSCAHDAAGIESLSAHPPDAVVMVVDCASRGGFAALRRVRAQLQSAPIVVVGRAGATSAAARQSLNAGAQSFVHEEDARRSLPAAVHAVLAGLVCVPSEVQRLVAMPTFSHREREVLELLVTGLANGQIALRLHLSESTVKSHLASAFAKLGVHSRKDAVALLLDPSEGLAASALPLRPSSSY
jgi:DNA-binding NarL/FixJ family response regulator